MEIKVTIIIALLLCFLNSSFFVLYDEIKRGEVVSADGSESNFPIFYGDKEKDLTVVDNRQVDETAIESEEAPVVSTQPVYKSTNSVSQDPATGGSSPTPDPSTPPQDPPPSTPGKNPPPPSDPFDVGGPQT